MEIERTKLLVEQKKLERPQYKILTTIDNKQHRKSRALFFTQNKSINRTLEYNTKISTIKDNFKKQNLITEKKANSPKLKNQKMPKFYT